jgi:predicted transcriptional regulator
MYYVIQRHHGDPKKHYLAYSVPRYISSEKSQNIIFEFQHNGETKRKWASKEDIVLLTDNQEFFQSTLKKLEALRSSHLEKIDIAQTQLDNEINALLNTMQNTFEHIQKNN